ncbi:MAG: 50S ribosomal protein L13 [Chloroflexi bacterium]|nr:50S ribosomal protein L13 [Chloroflexota bacterium]
MVALKRQRSYVAKPKDLHPKWYLFDASVTPLGRMATQIARILQGKHHPMYTPHINTGDFVVVVNASKVRLTGKKVQQKVYHFHSGYPGGLREPTVAQLLERTPGRVVEHAVQGMMPKGALGRDMLRRLKVYAGPTHPHEAQLKGSPAQPHPSAGAQPQEKESA